MASLQPSIHDSHHRSLDEGLDRAAILPECAVIPRILAGICAHVRDGVADVCRTDAVIALPGFLVGIALPCGAETPIRHALGGTLVS